MTRKLGYRKIIACLTVTLLLFNLTVLVRAEPTITITGRLVVHHKGEATGDLVPIPNARVEIYDEEIIEYPVVGWGRLPWLDTYLGAVYTDNNGYFTFTVNNNDGWTVLGDEKGRDVYLKFMASNRASAVKNNPGWLGGNIYSFKTNTNKNMVNGATWNIGSIAPNDPTCQRAFEVMYIVDLAWRHIKETTGTDLRKLNVFIDDFFIGNNSYYLNDKIADYLEISTPHLNPDYYPVDLINFLTSMIPEGLSPIERGMINDVAGIHLFDLQSRSTELYYEVIFHEYGHHIMYEMFDGGPPFTVSGPHRATDEFNPEHAWVEGWAEFYSCVASQRYGIDYTESFGNIENMGFDYTEERAWDSIEGNIAMILWDIIDETNEGHDGLSISFGELVNLLQSYDPRPDLMDFWPKTKDHVWDIHDVFEAFRSRYDLRTITNLWLLLEAHGITEPDTTPPNNPTSYTASHSSVFASTNTNIKVDLFGASDDMSGIEGYWFFWECRPSHYDDHVNGYWTRERIEPYLGHPLNFATSPHIEIASASEGDWYVFVSTFDNAGNWAGSVIRAGPFLVREQTSILMEGLIIHSPMDSFTTSDTTLTVAPPTYEGKTFTGQISLLPPGNGSLELDYTSPLSLLEILGSVSGKYDLEIKYYEETGEHVTDMVPLTLDNDPPVIAIQIGEPKYSSGPTFVSRNTVFTIVATDSGVGVERIEYKIYGSGFDSGWIEFVTPVYFTSLPDGVYTFLARAEDRLGNQDATSLMIHIDNSAPDTTITVGSPNYSDSPTAITGDTPLCIDGSDTGSGIHLREYRISSADDEGTWTEYLNPFTLSSLSDDTYVITHRCQDRLGNIQKSSISVLVDNAGPAVEWISVTEHSALQGTVTIQLEIADVNGVMDCEASIVQTDPEATLPPTWLPVTFNPITELWLLPIDTTLFDDGHYQILIKTCDALGNEGTDFFEYTIRNWGITCLTPNTENSKAGRTIPIKFNLHIVSSVDETEPSVYNEGLEIKIFTTNDPAMLLQSFTFGSTSTDYRISTESNQYICNFKTLKTPAAYSAVIIFNGVEIGTIGFSTTK